MKAKTILTACLLAATHLHSQNFQWVKPYGNSSSDGGRSITVDASGNVYTTGFFSGTVDFDPGVGTANLTSVGSNDVFVQKLDASGNLSWAKSFGGSSAEEGNSIKVDVSGNVYTTGYFGGTADFNPGAGTANLTSVGFEDVFVQKLDASGNFLWAKSFGGSTYDRGHSITVDALGNVYTTGYFLGTVDFDPGAGTANLNSAGNTDVFIQKLDTVGNFLWAKSFGGGSYDYVYSITVDTLGNVYTTGDFQGTVDFDPGAGTANHTSAGDNVFIQKLDVSGNFLWAKSFGGSSNDAGHSITLDASGNVYTTGYFRGTVDFDPGAGTANLNSAGNTDVFIQKLDTAGNFLWAKSFGGSSFDEGISITVDALGNVYTIGDFESTSDFDPGAGTANLTSAGIRDVFVQKLDNSGNFVWAKSFGGGLYDYGSSITVDAFGNVYTTGLFRDTVDFDPGAGTVNHTSAGDVDAFVLKLGQVPVPVELLFFDVRAQNKNVSISWSTASEINNDFFTIERSKTGGDWEMLAIVKGAGNSRKILNYNATDFTPYAGVSYYRLKQTDFDGQYEYSAIKTVNFNQLESEVFVYPNPANNQITIQASEQELSNIKIANHLGQDVSTQCKQRSESNGTVVIDLNTLPSGIYSIKTQTTANKVYKQ